MVTGKRELPMRKRRKVGAISLLHHLQQHASNIVTYKYRISVQ